MDSYILSEGNEMADQSSYPDDVQIIAGLRKGEERSATDLVLKYQKQLRAFLQYGMSVPGDQADEILNLEIFYKIIRKPSLIRTGTDQLRPLLYESCRNAAIDWHRKRKRDGEAFSEVVNELLEQGEICDPRVEPPSRFPEAHILLLIQSLSGLDQIYRETLEMVVHRCSYKEIAEMLGEKEGTIRQRYSRGLEYLRERYLNLLKNQPPEIQAKIKRKLGLGGEEIS